MSFELMHRYNVRCTLLEPRPWALCKLSRRQKSLLRAARKPVSEFRIPQIQSTLQADEGPHLEVCTAAPLCACTLLSWLHAYSFWNLPSKVLLPRGRSRVVDAGTAMHSRSCAFSSAQSVRTGALAPSFTQCEGPAAGRRCGGALCWWACTQMRRPTQS